METHDGVSSDGAIGWKSNSGENYTRVAQALWQSNNDFAQADPRWSGRRRGKEARGPFRSPRCELFRFPDLQVVIHGECARDALGANVSQILVGLIVDHAFERYMAVLHDDPNRLLDPERVFFESGITVDGAEQPHADLIIHRRGRQHFDL